MKKKFTKTQLDKLEKLHYLNSKFNGKGKKQRGLSEDEYEEYEKLKEECAVFLPLF